MQQRSVRRLKRIVADGSYEIDGLHKRRVGSEFVNPGIIRRIKTDQQIRIESLPNPGASIWLQDLPDSVLLTQPPVLARRVKRNFSSTSIMWTNLVQYKNGSKCNHILMLDRWSKLNLGLVLVKSKPTARTDSSNKTSKETIPEELKDAVLCDRCCRPMFRMRAAYWCTHCG